MGMYDAVQSTARLMLKVLVMCIWLSSAQLYSNAIDQMRDTNGMEILNIIF